MQHISNDLIFLLHDVARLMRTKFDQRARAWGMTRAQCVILMHLQKQPGLCQNEMAALCEVEPITVARLIDRLEASGLVERRADPSDRRVHRLHLQPEAEPILAEIGRYRQEVVSYFQEGIAKDDWETARSVLMNIKDKIVNTAAVSRPEPEAGE